MPATRFLELALDLAKQRQGFTAPNPAVGAVVVQDETVLGQGTHWAAGQPHAEVEALREVSPEASNLTVFVTLEPCCHWGKTPPCTRLLIERGVRRVVYAYRDPNPKVSGQGEAELRAAGIECEQVPLADADTFYAPYRHWVQTGRPWVTAKLALSLDGKIAGAQGAPEKLSGAELDRFTHHGRQTHDAILTTARTIQLDDPRLNVRTGDRPQAKPIYILDTRASLSPTKKIFETAGRLELFHGPEAPRPHLDRLAARHVRCREVPASAVGLDLPAVLEAIGKDGMHALWVEAGGHCFENLAQAGLLQKAYLYVSPRWLGDSAVSAFRSPEWLGRVKDTRWQVAGPDARCELTW